jgi:general secretion pathway protein A
VDYLDYYNIKEEPFGQAPNNKFFFDSPQHEQAMVRIMHAIEKMKGLAVLVGEIGTGKTMIARKLLYELPDEQYYATLLVCIHFDLSGLDLVFKLAHLLAVPGAETLTRRDEALEALFARLVELKDQNKKVVVLIDEAGILQHEEVRQEFRGILNLDYENERLVTFLFIGMPEINDYIASDPALLQRVACKYTLKAMEPSSTQQYIEHRLKIAGCESSPFTSDGYEQIHLVSRGTPRVINTVCDNVLLEGCLSGLKVLKAVQVEEVAENLGLTSLK